MTMLLGIHVEMYLIIDDDNLFLEPFLNNCLMFASIHSEGTIPSCRETINTFGSDVLICSTISLRSFGGIASSPGDLFSFNLLYFLLVLDLVRVKIVDIQNGKHLMVSSLVMGVTTSRRSRDKELSPRVNS